MEDAEASQIYNDVTLAMRWHQPLEYIKNLPLEDYNNVMQVLDAEYRISRSILKR